MAPDRSDVWKWISGILLAVLLTGGGMVLRDDFHHRALNGRLDDLNRSVTALTDALNGVRLTLKIHDITDESAAEQAREGRRLHATDPE